MADPDMLMIFRSLDTGELLTRKTKLLNSMTTMTSQTVGSKSFTRDIRHLNDQLSAIVFVLNERSNPGAQVPYMVTDFSGARPAPPRGTEESLSY